MKTLFLITLASIFSFTADIPKAELPIFTKKVTPQYPEKAVKLSIQGYVIVEAILKSDGTVGNVKVIQSLGKDKLGFNTAAVDAVKQWEFIPGKKDGVPVDVKMTLKIDFLFGKDKPKLKNIFKRIFKK